MKKNIKRAALTVLVAGAMAISLVACGSDNSNNNSGNETTTASQAETQSTGGFAFDYNGTKIALNGNMADILAKLGDPADYFESESCAFQGMDKVYTYNSFIIRTYPENGADYVLSISLKDDTVETDKGICIGSSKDDVINAYGEGEGTEASVIYKDAGTTLGFVFEDGKVASIEYTAVK